MVRSQGQDVVHDPSAGVCRHGTGHAGWPEAATPPHKVRGWERGELHWGCTMAAHSMTLPNWDCTLYYFTCMQVGWLLSAEREDARLDRAR